MNKTKTPPKPFKTKSLNPFYRNPTLGEGGE
jgi:hypothetical protein